jgi:hypothetical protein
MIGVITNGIPGELVPEEQARGSNDTISAGHIKRKRPRREEPDEGEPNRRRTGCLLRPCRLLHPTAWAGSEVQQFRGFDHTL